MRHTSTFAAAALIGLFSATGADLYPVTRVAAPETGPCARAAPGQPATVTGAVSAGAGSSTCADPTSGGGQNGASGTGANNGGQGGVATGGGAASNAAAGSSTSTTGAGSTSGSGVNGTTSNTGASGNATGGAGGAGSTGGAPGGAASGGASHNGNTK